MQALRVEPFDPASSSAWDDLVARSVNGTFLHSRRYLDYHGDRFTDRSVAVYAPGLVAVLPAAVDPTDPSRVSSHPGISYGGVVHDGSLRAEDLVQVLTQAADLFAAGGATSLRYKAVPPIYHRLPAGDDLYALTVLGATLYRRDLSATVELAARAPVRRNRRRNLAAAVERGATIERSRELLPDFWGVLTQSLASRHSASPVHTLDEMISLMDRFPEAISVETVMHDGEVVGGTLHYATPRVLHCQYSASSEKGMKVFALDLAFSTAIQAAARRGTPYYNFGISTESEGKVLNSTLYDFKRSFGAGSTVCDFYELKWVS